MRLLLPLALLLAAPVRAQTPDGLGDATPEAVLSATWAEALGGAEAVAWALDDVAADTAGAPPETAGEAGRARATAALAAAATSATLSAAVQFSVALADEGQRETVYAALGADASGLHEVLMLVAETVAPPDDPAVLRAGPDETPAPPGVWAERAAQIRALAGRLQGAAAALGLSIIDR